MLFWIILEVLLLLRLTEFLIMYPSSKKCNSIDIINYIDWII